MNSNIKKYIVGDFSLKRILFFSLFLYLAFSAFAFFHSDNMIFLPHSPTYEIDNKSFISLKRPNAPNLAIVYIKNSKSDKIILYSHGNAEDLGEIQPFLENISKILEVSVIAYDYQGFGHSTGTPSEQNCYDDINFSFNYITQNLKIKPKNIIVWGRSVGSGPACELASKKDVALLVLESPFTSTFRVLTHYKILPFDKFDNLSKIDKVTAPVFIIHGTNDKVIPNWHGKALFNKIQTKKYSVWIDGAGHNNLRYHNLELYQKWLYKIKEKIKEN